MFSEKKKGFQKTKLTLCLSSVNWFSYWSKTAYIWCEKWSKSGWMDEWNIYAQIDRDVTTCGVSRYHAWGINSAENTHACRCSLCNGGLDFYAFISPGNEWMNDNFIYTRLKTSVWEYWSENHLWELLLKRPKEFDVRISSGRLFHRRAPQ